MIKRFLFLLAAFFCLSSICYAADDAELPEFFQDLISDDLDDPDDLDEGDWILDSIEVYSTVSPITPSNTDGLKSVLLSLLGNYDPIIVEYRYMNSNNTTYSYLREAQPDYVWMASFILVALMIFCLFRLGGAVLCRR